MRVVVALALLAWAALCTLVFAQDGEVEVFPQPVEMQFPQGYDVYSDAGKLLKTVPGPTSATIQAKASGKAFAAGEVYLSDWSYERIQQGEKPNWILSKSSPSGAGGAERQPFQQDTANQIKQSLDMAMRLLEQKRYKEALPLIRGQLPVLKGMLGSNHPAVSEARRLSLNTEARWKKAEGDLAGAARLYVSEYEIAKNSLGLTNSETITALNNAGAAMFESGDMREAERLFLIQLETLQAISDQASPLLGDTLNNLGACRLAQGDRAPALELFSRALKIRMDGDCPDPVGAAQTLNNIGALLSENAELDRALEYFEQALKIRKEMLGDEHADVAETMNNIAGIYRGKKDLPKSISIYSKALGIAQKAAGLGSPQSAKILDNLLMVYQMANKTTEEVALRERVLSDIETECGKSDPRANVARLNLAHTYSQIGRFSEAAHLYETQLAITPSSEITETAVLMGRVGTAKVLGGEPTAAIPFLEGAFSLSKEKFGPDAVETAEAMMDLAFLRTALGDKKKAEALNSSALSLLEKKVGRSDRRTLVALANVAQDQTDERRALEMHKELLQAYERLGDNEQLPICLYNVGQSHFLLGENTEAKHYADQAVGLLRESGVRDPILAACLDLRGRASVAAGEISDALADFDESVRLLEVVKGESHPQTEYSLRRLSEAYYLAGDIESASETALRALGIARQQLDSVLMADERTRLTWHQNHYDLGSMPCFLTPAYVAQCLLDWKGVVLASLMRDRAMERETAGSDVESLTARLAGLQEQLGSSLYGSKGTDSLQKLRKQISETRRQIAKETRMFSQSDRRLSVAELQQSLPEANVFIDLFRYVDPVNRPDSPVCYGAVIYRRDGGISLAAIPDAEKIDRMSSEARSAAVMCNDKELLEKFNELSRLVWDPIAKHIPQGTKRLLINPESSLQFLSFACLLRPDGSLVGEQLDIAYVASAHDLIREPLFQEKHRAALFGNPLFANSGASSTVQPIASDAGASMWTVELNPLPGSREEVDDLDKLLRESEWRSEKLVEEKASEESLRSLGKVDILHLATHGFFLGGKDVSRTTAFSRGMSVAPVAGASQKVAGDPEESMRLSGVALAGAQATLVQWARGEVVSSANDGILTAEEVACLPLQGTWLVTLSACDTGLGGASSGEGVFGLRRAFSLAGAENLLMTLWPVDDAGTRFFMRDFYVRAVPGENVASAFSETQRSYLAKLRKTQGAAQAIRQVGPFALVLMTRPQ